MSNAKLSPVPSPSAAPVKKGRAPKPKAGKPAAAPDGVIPALKAKLFGAPKTRRQASSRKAGETFKTAMTFSMACAVPAVALAATRIAGTCAAEGTAGMYVLGAVGAILASTMMLLSVGHLRDGVMYLTGDSVRNATLLAWALDGFMLFSEATHAFGPQDAIVQGVALTFLVGCALLSMALNWTAFRYAGEVGKIKARAARTAAKRAK